MILRCHMLTLILLVALWSGAGVALRHHFAEEESRRAQASLMHGQSIFQPELLRWSLRMDTISSIHPHDWQEAKAIQGIAARLIGETDGWIETLNFPGTDLADPGGVTAPPPEPVREILAGQPRDLRRSSWNIDDLLADCRLSHQERRTVAGRVYRTPDNELYLSLAHIRDLGAGHYDCLVLTVPKAALRFGSKGSTEPVSHDVVLIDAGGQPLARIAVGLSMPINIDPSTAERVLRPEEIGFRQPLLGLPDWSIVTLEQPPGGLQKFARSLAALLIVLTLVFMPLALLPREAPAPMPAALAPAPSLPAQRMTRHERRGLALNALAHVRGLLRAPDTPLAMHRSLAGIGTALDTLLTLEDRPADGVLAPTVFHPGDLAQEILTLLRPAADEAQVSLRSWIDWPYGLVRGPREAVVQVLINLIQNALKYAPGAQVALTLSAESDTSGNRVLVLEVADTGPGVPVEQEKWLFRPGFRASDMQQGEGLGLTIIARLAHAAGGSVALRNAPGEGMAVTVRIPVIAANRPVEDLPRLDGMTLLVVEDSAALRNWIVQQLLRLGAEVEGVGAISEARMSADRLHPDAAVVDLSLDDGSGLDLARHLRHDHPHLHLIAFSADIDADRQAACLAAGFDAVQRKEPDLTALITVLAGFRAQKFSKKVG